MAIVEPWHHGSLDLSKECGPTQVQELCIALSSSSNHVKHTHQHKKFSKFGGSVLKKIFNVHELFQKMTEI